MRHRWGYIGPELDSDIGYARNGHIWKCENCGMTRLHHLRDDDYIVTYLDHPDALNKNYIFYKNQTCEEFVLDSVMKQ